MLSDPDQHARRGGAAAASTSWSCRTSSSPRRRALADVVLPAASFAEKDGTFTNTERRVQRVRARRAGAGRGARRLGDRRRAGAAAWAPALGLRAPAPTIMAEIAALTPSYGGISLRAARRDGGLCWPCPDAVAPGHAHPAHRRSSRAARASSSRSPTSRRPRRPTTEYPLTLTTGRMLEHYHTGTMTRRSDGLNELVPTGFVEINPGDAGGARRRRRRRRSPSRRGAARSSSCRRNVTARVRPGTVFVPFHFWESPANRLTNPARDPMAKIPEFKVCACRVTAEAAASTGRRPRG